MAACLLLYSYWLFLFIFCAFLFLKLLPTPRNFQQIWQAFRILKKHNWFSSVYVLQTIKVIQYTIMMQIVCRPYASVSFKKIHGENGSKNTLIYHLPLLRALARRSTSKAFKMWASIYKATWVSWGCLEIFCKQRVSWNLVHVKFKAAWIYYKSLMTGYF